MKTQSLVCCVVLLATISIQSHGTGWMSVSAQEETIPAGGPGPATGIYLVQKTVDDAHAIELAKKDQQIVKRVDSDWGDVNSRERYLLINNKPNVPLQLAAEPVVVKDSENGDRIKCRLVGKSADKLYRFTKENLGGSAAVIIKGDVVLVATIRAPIRDAAFAISFCTNGKAEPLAKKLRGAPSNAPRKE